jgi:hypothetical protein
MKSSFTLSIPRPCREKFENFSKTHLGGFCSSCQKEVIDFTLWDEEKIKAYFKNHTGAACARFRNHQLKKYSRERPDISRQHKWLPLSVLSASLLFNQYSTAQEIKKPQQEANSFKVGKVNPQKTADPLAKKEVKGTVVSRADSIALPGVTVRLKGTDMETTTNVEGKFMISVDHPQPSDTLVFLFVGYESCEKNIFSTEEFAVAMKEEAFVLGGTIGGLVVQYPKWWSPKGIWWRIRSIF